MAKNKKYVDEIEEIIHPFWLGLIMLFTVIILVGTLCIVRRKCRSNLRYLWNWLCCRSELNDGKKFISISHNFSFLSFEENYVKTIKSTLPTNPYQWGTTYAPPPSSPPKLYKLVRSMRTISIESNAPIEHTEDNAENTVNNIIFAKANQTEYPKVEKDLFFFVLRIDLKRFQTSNPNRNPEAARKLFASLRNPSLDPHSSSIDSTNTEIGEEKKKGTRRNRLKFIRTSPFLQSITYGRD